MNFLSPFDGRMCVEWRSPKNLATCSPKQEKPASKQWHCKCKCSSPCSISREFFLQTPPCKRSGTKSDALSLLREPRNGRLQGYHKMIPPLFLCIMREKSCGSHILIQQAKTLGFTLLRCKRAMRVCVYGSSSKQTPQKYLDAAFKLGELLAERNHVCVNGGGKAGCMGAVNEGCKQRKGRIICVIHEIFLVDKEEVRNRKENPSLESHL